MSQSLPPVSILGIGAVTPLGRDLGSIRQRLNAVSDSSLRCSMFDVRCSTFDSTPTSNSQPGHPQALRVSDDLLVNPATSVQLRRADRFIRMAVIAAGDAWEASKESRSGIPPERIGLILSSGFGPHCRGFRFLDGILDAGDTAASPTDFSHSVHGAAAAYISRLLDIRGPSLSLTDFEIGFEEAVRIAQCWLTEKSCDRILIGAVEELGEVYLDCANRMLQGRTGISLGEGALFLMIGPSSIQGIARLNATTSSAAADLVIIEDPTILPATAVAAEVGEKQTASFTGAFGLSASSTAFSLLGGLLTMGDAIDTAALVRTSSEGRTVILQLEK